MPRKEIIHCRAEDQGLWEGSHWEKRESLYHVIGKTNLKNKKICCFYKPVKTKVIKNLRKIKSKMTNVKTQNNYITTLNN